MTYNGTQWTSLNSGVRGNLYGVWGTSPTDVWAVGDYYTAMRYQP